VTTFFLTLSNPTTIASFLAIFAGFGLTAESGYLPASLMVLGVFIGSAFWWLILSTMVGILHARITPRWMRMINWFSGCMIFGFGVYFLVMIVRS